MGRVAAGWIAGTDSLWEQAREGGADSISLQRRISIACGQYAKLNRYHNLFLAGQADCNNQVTGNDTVTVYI